MFFKSCFAIFVFEETGIILFWLACHWVHEGMLGVFWTFYKNVPTSFFLRTPGPYAFFQFWQLEVWVPVGLSQNDCLGYLKFYIISQLHNVNVANMCYTHRQCPVRDGCTVLELPGYSEGCYRLGICGYSGTAPSEVHQPVTRVSIGCWDHHSIRCNTVFAAASLPGWGKQIMEYQNQIFLILHKQ